MIARSKRISTLLVTLLFSASLFAADRVHHNLTIELDPAAHRLNITDQIQLPSRLASEALELLLNSSFEILESNAKLEVVPVGETTGFYGINGSSVELGNQVEINRYRVTGLPAGERE
jgi:hypothetical protein